MLWDTTSGHASVAPEEYNQQWFATCVSSEPWTRSSVGVDAYPQVLPPNKKMFKPIDFNSDCAPDGCFIIDSFYYSKKSKKKTDHYLPRLLAELQRYTGLTIFALCSGGAGILHRSNGSALYSEMLDYVPSGLQFILLMTFGNDWYNTTVKSFCQPLRVAAERLCIKMQTLSERQFAVVGGSAQTWGYGKWMQPQSMNQYDTNAKALCDIFRCMNVVSVTGADELQGIVLADSIGNV